MASGTNPSSKQKSSSSSSYKKKLSKKSSQVRKRKRSRSRKRDKSKKLLRRRDFSCSDDDDDSRSLSSYSEDDFKRRKGRSRTREDVREKKSKKRIKKRYSSDDDDDTSVSVSPIRKKRKGYKKTDGDKVKRKSRKGRSRRDASVDSISSGSRSCSTCRGGSDSEGGDFERSRRRGRKEKDKIPKKRYRSRSCSPFSHDNEQIRYNEERSFVHENHSRYLKSVITIPDEYIEERYQDQDETKAEVMQAYDDCPSPKSNDSFDGGSKKEIAHEVFPEKKIELHKDMIDDAFTSKSKLIQPSQSSAGNVENQHDNKDHTGNIDLTKTSITSSEVEDLESILRQKALENLRKFRQHKGGNETGAKQSSVSKDEPIKIETRGSAIETHNTKITVMEGAPISNLPKQTVQIPKAGDKMVENKAEEKKIINFSDIRKPRQNPFVYIRDPSSDSSVLKQTSKSRDYSDGKSRDIKTIVNKIASEPSKPSVSSTVSHEIGKRAATVASKTPIVRKIVSQSSKVSAVSSNPHETYKAPESAASESKTIVSKIVSEPLKAPVRSGNTLDTVSSELISPTVEKVASETPQASAGSSDPREIKEVHGSSPPGASSQAHVTGEDCPIETGNASTGGSGFEQKTMSVMRGGEMVQVSYKVYIPKKAPALARRKLQR